MTSLFYKGAVNIEGQLKITDPDAKHTIGQAAFSFEEAKALEAQDCRPVVVQVVKAYKVRSDVVEAE